LTQTKSVCTASFPPLSSLGLALTADVELRAGGSLGAPLLQAPNASVQKMRREETPTNRDRVSIGFSDFRVLGLR
jgi:hypothetical protein